jgi:hypothetical protein
MKRNLRRAIFFDFAVTLTFHRAYRFDIARWTGCVHRFVPLSKREHMKRHLREDCEPCRRLAELVARVQEERAAEPVVPEHLVRAAIAVFRSGAAPRRERDVSTPRAAY